MSLEEWEEKVLREHGAWLRVQQAEDRLRFLNGDRPARTGNEIKELADQTPENVETSNE